MLEGFPHMDWFDSDNLWVGYSGSFSMCLFLLLCYHATPNWLLSFVMCIIGPFQTSLRLCMHVHVAASLDTLNQFIQLQREYEIINIPRDFRAYKCAPSWVSPYICSVEAKEKLWGLQRISSWNVIVPITDHSHTFIVTGSWGILLKIAIKVYYEKSMGIKVMTQHFCQRIWSFCTSSGWSSSIMLLHYR